MKEMTAIEYFREKKRLTKSCKIDCEDCPLSDYNNSEGVLCEDLEYDYPDIAIPIMQKWSEEHPRKTMLQDLLEKYPNAKIASDGVPNFCPDILGYSVEEYCGLKCKECWNRPLNEKVDGGEH